MSIFGLLTRKESRKLIADAVKQALNDAPGWLQATAGAELHNVQDPELYGAQSDLYRRLSWVLAAVMHVASEAALTAGQVMKHKGEDSEDVKNHEFELLLQRPNPLDSHYEFMYATVAEYKLTGNAYWWLNRTDEKTKPDELWFLPSHMVMPVPDRKMFLEGYLYYPGDGQQILLKPHEVVQFRSFNPFSRFVGLSAIESLAMTAHTVFGMKQVGDKYYNDGGGRSPSILLFADMIENDQWRKIQSDTKAAAKDRQLMMLRGVGAGNVTLLQNSISAKDQELLGQMDAAREEIFTVLAPGLASMLDVSATEANALAGRATFKERAVYPLLVTIAEKITSSILPSYGEDLYFEYDDIRWADRQMELSEIAEYSKTHTVEEIRAQYYNDKPLGDDRDILLPGQVKPEDGRPEPEPEETPVEQTVIGEPEEEVEEAETGNTELSPEQVASLVELDRWDEKSKKAGKLTRWHPVALNVDIYEAVKGGAMTFQEARNKVKSVTVAPLPVIVEDEKPGYIESQVILEAMKAEVETILLARREKNQDVNVTVHNYPTKEPVVNVSQPDFKMDTPNVTIVVDPTPINIENKVNVDVPQQPAPTVNVEPVINIPERKPKKVKINYDKTGKPTELEG